MMRSFLCVSVVMYAYACYRSVSPRTKAHTMLLYSVWVERHAVIVFVCLPCACRIRSVLLTPQWRSRPSSRAHLQPERL